MVRDNIVPIRPELEIGDTACDVCLTLWPAASLDKEDLFHRRNGVCQDCVSKKRGDADLRGRRRP